MIEQEMLIRVYLRPGTFGGSVDEVRRQVQAAVDERLGSRVWNKEPPVFVSSGASDGGAAAPPPPVFHATMRYGDDVGDEWALVHALLQLTGEAADDSPLAHAAIAVSDDDGQFLLIEAAHHLPEWLEPDCEDNRVFLYRGRLHIVAPADLDGPIGPLPLHAGLQALWQSPPDATAAEPAAQQAIQARCASAAETSAEHRCACVIPDRLARVLRQAPQLVAAAVHCLADDPHSVKALKRLPVDGASPPTTLRLHTVRFSRMLYAKLIRARFRVHPQIGFEQAATAALAAAAGDLPASQQQMAVDMGARLTCAFELLLSTAQSPPPPPPPSSSSSSSTATSAAAAAAAAAAAYRDEDAPEYALQAMQAADRTYAEPGDPVGRALAQAPLVHESDSWMTVTEADVERQTGQMFDRMKPEDIRDMLNDLMKDDPLLLGQQDGDDGNARSEPLQLDNEALEQFRASLGMEKELLGQLGPSSLLFFK